MSEHPLAASAAKLRWAQRHLDTLAVDIGGYFKLHPVRLLRQTYEESVEDELRVRSVLMIDLPPESAPDLLAWSLRVGDIAHNMRASLDYMAWQLAIRNLGREPTENEARNVAFPIVTDPKRFPGRFGQHLAASDIALLERFQPYHRRNPDKDRLAVLAKLSNEDKHRIPHVTVTVLEDFKWESDVLSGNGVIERVRMRRNVPLKHKAVVGEFVIRWATGTTKANRKFDYDNEGLLYVSLPKRLRVHGDGGSVLGTLNRIGKRITDVSKAIERTL